MTTFGSSTFGRTKYSIVSYIWIFWDDHPNEKSQNPNFSSSALSAAKLLASNPALRIKFWHCKYRFKSCSGGVRRIILFIFLCTLAFTRKCGVILSSFDKKVDPCQLLFDPDLYGQGKQRNLVSFFGSSGRFLEEKTRKEILPCGMSLNFNWNLIYLFVTLMVIMMMVGNRKEGRSISHSVTLVIEKKPSRRWFKPMTYGSWSMHSTTVLHLLPYKLLTLVQ